MLVTHRCTIHYMILLSLVLGTLTANALKFEILKLNSFGRILFDGHKCASTTCRHSCTSTKQVRGEGEKLRLEKKAPGLYR